MRTPIFILLISVVAVACDDDADVPPGAVDDAMANEMDATVEDAALPDAATDVGIDTSVPDAVAENDAGLSADAAPSPDACVPDDEVCNGLDDDCDGVTDEGLVDRPCWEGPGGTQGQGECRNGVRGCIDGTFGACIGQVLPEAERCNGLDDDCDGAIDEQLARSCDDIPPVGECTRGAERCVDGAWQVGCTGAVEPSTDVCDGLDNDCDGLADEDHPDQDGDGEADCVDADSDGDGVADPDDVCPSVADAEQTDTDGDGAGDACDDDDDGDGAADVDDCGPLDADAHPGADETCDGDDDDCDGAVDEALSQACFDGDPALADVGACRSGTQVCAAGVWGACEGAVLPGDEACDGVDQDCDGTIDEGLDAGWPDVDGDGFGDGGAAPTCPAAAGQADNPDDCDDGDAAVNPDADDRPDAAFLDADCDGVDGAWAALVFVDAAADAAGADGTAAAPFVTIADALATGAADIAVRAGRYPAFTAADGVSVHGGYGPGWARAVETETIIDGAPADIGRVAIEADGIVTPTTLGWLVVEPGAAPPGESSVGVRARGATALRLEQVVVRGGVGGAGAPGEAGAMGAAGGAGSNGGDCGGGVGSGGASPCDQPGGEGGAGNSRGNRGQNGSPEGCGGGGGSAGNIAAGDDGGRGCDGATGAAGGAGDGAEGGAFVDGVWVAGRGRAGGDGAPGLGGGGGGGGGGAAVIGGTGGAGGGGGGGACGGEGGQGGGGGGGAFALLAVDSPGLTVVGGRLSVARGGEGGAGGAGGPGGSGGDGGGGGSGREAFACGGLAGPGAGGDGGRGGAGGPGGAGAGGPGGPAYAVLCVGAPVQLDGVALEPGDGGPGGGGPGLIGPAGPRAEVVGCE